MRILLDECVNPRLRLAFPGDDVKTVAEMGWRALTNGALFVEAGTPIGHPPVARWLRIESARISMR